MDLQKRIAEEKRIVTLTIETLIAAGFAVSADNGESATKISKSAAVAVAEAFDTDDVRIRAYEPLPNGKFVTRGWVYFVFGNEAHEVLNDYTTNLETALAPVNAELERMEAAL